LQIFQSVFILVSVNVFQNVQSIKSCNLFFWIMVFRKCDDIDFSFVVITRFFDHVIPPYSPLRTLSITSILFNSEYSKLSRDTPPSPVTPKLTNSSIKTAFLCSLTRL